ncbi:hypothetical protein ACGGZK_18095 [Agromyces sp. MMS24-K17]|uniref:hypothetical protein n=1 Tax=Agromyces sp. MMS24-K17 TaxID=3372850 RepID=UPI003753EEB5
MALDDPTAGSRRHDLVTAWAAADWHPGRLRGRPDLDPGHPTAVALRDRAHAALGTPWPTPTQTAYARYVRDGDRSEWEGAVFARMERVATAVAAALVDDDPRLLDEASDGLLLCCEQSTWCWPAHDDVFTRTGGVAADPDHPFLDLGAGEMVGLLAWARLALGDRLEARTPGLVERMRREARRRVLDPFTTRRDWTWLGLTSRINNWNPWIHGNVIVAAAAFEDDPAASRAIVDLAVDGIDRYLAALPDDGAIDEGFAYWWNGVARALDALEVLERGSAGFDASTLPGLPELLRFPLRAQLGDGWVLSYADAEPRVGTRHPWRIAFHWGRRLDLADVAGHAAGFRTDEPDASAPNGGLGRTLAAVADADWRHAEAGPAPLPRSVRFDSLDLALAREAAGTARGLAIALKGGANDENHNHNDLGSVQVALDGVPVVIDLGRPEYDARTFGPDRYDLWPVRSDWHAVPEPRGLVQEAGGHRRTGPLEGGDDGADASWRINLTGAWGLDDAGGEAWARGIRLDRATSTATLVDEWTLDAHPGTRSTLVVWGEVSTAPDGAVLVRPDVDGARALRIDHDAAHVEVEHRDIDDPVLRRAWGDRVTRLRFAPGAGAQQLELRFRAADADAPGAAGAASADAAGAGAGAGAA